MKTYTVDYQDKNGMVIIASTGEADDIAQFLYHIMPPPDVEGTAIIWIRETMKEDGSSLLRRTDRKEVPDDK